MSRSKHDAFVKHLKSAFQEDSVSIEQLIASLDDLTGDDEEDDIRLEKLMIEIEKKLGLLFASSDQNDPPDPFP